MHHDQWPWLTRSMSPRLRNPLTGRLVVAGWQIDRSVVGMMILRMAELKRGLYQARGLSMCISLHGGGEDEEETSE